MAALLRLMAETRRRADWAFIYLREAHPVDAQHFGPAGQAGVDLATHHSLQQRADAARWLVETEGLDPDTIYLDDMDDAAGAAFNAFPDRLAVVQSGVLRYSGGPGPFGFNIDEVRDWLERYMAASGDNE